MKKRILFLMIFSLSSVFAFAQSTITLNSQSEPTSFSLLRKIEFNKESKTEEIEINVQEKTMLMTLQIRGRVSSGKLSIQIYNSDGVKEGEFSVGTQTTTSQKEEADGSIVKSVYEPKPGKWKIKIVPEAVEGYVRIETVSKI